VVQVQRRWWESDSNAKVAAATSTEATWNRHQGSRQRSIGENQQRARPEAVEAIKEGVGPAQSRRTELRGTGRRGAGLRRTERREAGRRGAQRRVGWRGTERREVRLLYSTEGPGLSYVRPRCGIHF
jgi:hypothetical protein